MPKFLSFQTVVQFRVPVMDDGTCGNPEIIRKFTTQMKGEHSFAPTKKNKTNLTSQQGDDEELA